MTTHFCPTIKEPSSFQETSGRTSHSDTDQLTAGEGNQNMLEPGANKVELDDAEKGKAAATLAVEKHANEEELVQVNKGSDKLTATSFEDVCELQGLWTNLSPQNY